LYIEALLNQQNGGCNVVTRFLCLYEGRDVESAALKLVTGDQEMIREFCSRLLSEEPEPAGPGPDHRQSKNGREPYRGQQTRGN
jgi:hypothetical protein